MERLLGPARIILGNRDFTVLLCCNVVLGIAYSFVVPFLSMFGTLEVGMSPAIFGLFMTISSVSGVVLSTVLARWSDTRTSRRTILIVASCAGVLGYIGYAFVREVFWLTVISSVFLGIASVTFSQVFAYARDLLARSDVPAEHTPLYMNVFRLFFALAWTVGPALAAAVMTAFSFRGTFLVAALFYALFLLLVVLFVPSLPPRRESLEAAVRMPLRKAAAIPGLLAHFCAFCLFFCCSTLGMMNLPLLVVDELRGTETHVGIVYSVAPLFELPFMFYFGLLASRSDHGRLIRFALWIAVAYYGLLSLVTAPFQVYLLQILSAAIVAVTSGVAITFFQNFLPDQAGTATNVYSTASRIGATSGYLLFGVLVTGRGHRDVFIVCAVFCFLAVAILHLARRPPASPSPAL